MATNIALCMTEPHLYLSPYAVFCCLYLKKECLAYRLVLKKKEGTILFKRQKLKLANHFKLWSDTIYRCFPI